jgi:hypothetical protein
MVGFQCPWLAWQPQTPIPFPAVKQVYSEIYRKLEKPIIWISWTSESHWWYLFHRQVKGWDSRPGSRFENFKLWLKRGIFKCISWLNGVFFGNKSGFSERRSQDLLNGTNAALELANIFSVFASIVCASLRTFFHACAFVCIIDSFFNSC